ncbi:conserved Plasmodium protein, unknown function [Plasmodium sp. gorilla clade G3]|nr:conserved Plasmodium protein, unknown function [Plasmodium sp. gorilla clade G3]
MKGKDNYIFCWILLICSLYLINVILCKQNILKLSYQINSFNSDAQKKEWNNIGSFILNSSEIYDISNSYVEEKRKFLQKMKNVELQFDYVLFQLCYDENKCLETYVNKEKIININNFVFLLGLDNNYTPFILNYKIYNDQEEHNQNINKYNNEKIFSNLFIIKFPTVSTPINLNNITAEDIHMKPKTQQHEKVNEQNKPKSFLRKYWFVILIFFLSLSFSKHLTENEAHPPANTSR